jgi:DNA primase
VRPSESQKSWLGALADRYHAALDETTLSYLAARGIGPDAAAGYRLGLVSDPDPAHEQFYGRLSIPYITPTGVVYMRFRCLEPHDCGDMGHGKYLGVSGDPTHLYNVQALHLATSEIAVIEGEVDGLVSTEAGMPAVGVPGATNWKPFYYRLFDDFERVIVIGDGDKAGREFVATLARNLGNSIRRPMPEGHDVNSFVLEHGADAYLAYITKG